MNDRHRRPSPYPTDGVGADQTLQWSGGLPPEGTAGTVETAQGGGFGSDPWNDYASVEGTPPPSGPNWPLIVGATVGAIALLVGVLLLTGGGADEGPQTTVEPTLPLDGPTSSTSLAIEVEPVARVSTAVITVTEEPQECVGGAGSEAPLEKFLNAALSQQGTPYRFGAEVDPLETNPPAFDSSELVEWAATQAGVTLRDGSWIQYLDLEGCGAAVGLADGLATPGALVFGFPAEPVDEGERPEGSFVAISLGDGRIVDVSEPEVSVRFAADMPASRVLTHAAVVPDLGRGKAEYLP